MTVVVTDDVSVDVAVEVIDDVIEVDAVVVSEVVPVDVNDDVAVDTVAHADSRRAEHDGAHRPQPAACARHGRSRQGVAVLVPAPACLCRRSQAAVGAAAVQ